jgi:signal transduction histidine kinase
VLLARAQQAWVDCAAPHALPQSAWEAISLLPHLCAALEKELGMKASRLTSARVFERFGRMLAHELRNRVDSADLALQQLELLAAARGQEAAKERELITRARGAVQGLVAVAGDVGALVSSGETGGEPLPLRRVVERVVARLASLAEDGGVRVEVASGLPTVRVDSGRLELVLSNLLTNSINYRDRAGDDPWVRIEARRLEGEQAWCVAVADNGVGIPEPLRERVFELFFRGADPSVPGTGLGLAIAQDAVTQMGGRIWLESAEGRGTTFSFTVCPARP